MATILVVDDSRLSRGILADVLKDAGYDVIEAVDGKQALAVYEARRPDCVVSDLLMPVMGGREFLRRLRESGADVPVIIASADIQQASCSECEALGISGFLNKPVSSQQLVESVSLALSQTAQSPSQQGVAS